MRDILDGIIGMFQRVKGAISSKTTDVANMLVKGGQANSLNNASKNIAYFPVVVSDSMSYENMELILKAMERECAVKLQLLLTQLGITPITIGADLTSNLPYDFDNSVHESAHQREYFSTSFLREDFFSHIAPMRSYNVTSMNDYTHIHRKEINMFKESANANLFTEDMKIEPSFKKYSEAQPTMISVKMDFIMDGLPGQRGPGIIEREVMFGVKVLPIRETRNNIFNNLKDIMENTHTGFKFMTMLSGQKSFFKDFLFGIDLIKKLHGEDKDSKSTKVKEIWKHMYEGRDNAIMKRLMSDSRNLPTASIAISKEDYLEFREMYGYDLKKQNVIDHIFKNLFLLDFVIIDENAKIADKYNFTFKAYNTYSFEFLKKQAENDDIMKALITHTAGR